MARTGKNRNKPQLVSTRAKFYAQIALHDILKLDTPKERRLAFSLVDLWLAEHEWNDYMKETYGSKKKRKA